MKNRIEAHIAFSYQGKDYDLTSTIDLDTMMKNQKEFPDFHMMLAQQNSVDTYSYLYEVMESHEITFSNATGIAKSCLTNYQFDLENFKKLWQEDVAFTTLQRIANKHLSITDLNQQPKLKDALLEAFMEGKATIT